jgi:hypothetical protein
VEVWVISFFFAIGGATWIYTKMMRSTGNNTASVLVVAGMAGLFIFLVAWSALSMFM